MIPLFLLNWQMEPSALLASAALIYFVLYILNLLTIPYTAHVIMVVLTRRMAQFNLGHRLNHFHNTKSKLIIVLFGLLELCNRNIIIN